MFGVCCLGGGWPEQSLAVSHAKRQDSGSFPDMAAAWWHRPPSSHLAPCSQDSEDLHSDRAGEVRNEHGQHEDAECAAKDHAADAVEFGEELGADKLRLYKENKDGYITDFPAKNGESEIRRIKKIKISTYEHLEWVQ